MENKAVYVAMSMGHTFHDLLLHGMYKSVLSHAMCVYMYIS